MSRSYLIVVADQAREDMAGGLGLQNEALCGESEVPL